MTWGTRWIHFSWLEGCYLSPTNYAKSMLSIHPKLHANHLPPHPTDHYKFAVSAVHTLRGYLPLHAQIGY